MHSGGERKAHTDGRVVVTAPGRRPRVPRVGVLSRPHPGGWKVYGLHLPDEVLEKVYNKNAKKVFAQFKGLKEQDAQNAPR